MPPKQAEEDCEFEKIIERRPGTRKGTFEYLLRWSGVDENGDPWEDEWIHASKIKDKELIKQFNASIPVDVPDTTLVLIDIEFHWMGGPICQLYALTMDGKKHFNRYILHKRLAPEWQRLVDAGVVELARWDDPRKTVKMSRALREFRLFLNDLEGVVVVFKGVSDPHQLALADTHRELRGVQFVSIDKIWAGMDNIPAFLMPDIVYPNKTLAYPLKDVWDALFWYPVLVRIDSDLDKPDTIPLVHLKDTVYFDGFPSPPWMEFTTAGRLTPAWHTAHTDTIAMWIILCFLAFLEANTTQETLYALSTYVVHKTRNFREPQTIQISPVKRQSLYRLARDLAKPYTLGVPAPARARPPKPPADFDNASSVMAGRERRLKHTEMIEIELHDRSNEKLYRPLTTGRDAIKVRALRTLIGEAEDKGTIYDRLDRERMQAIAPNQPWFYYPVATGKVRPGYQVLHTRTCQDRKNGHAHGKEPDYDQDNIAYYDFAAPHTVPGYKLQFCKACKEYASAAQASFSNLLWLVHALR